MSFMQFRAGAGRSSAVLRVDAKGRYTLFVGVTDVGGGAKTTMGMIAAEELGVPLSQVQVVWGDTDRCPYSVGESGSRTTIMTGYAVVEAGLAAMLSAAIQLLEDADPGNDGGASNLIVAFINAVGAQSGSQISTEEADALIDSAQAILDILNGA